MRSRSRKLTLREPLFVYGLILTAVALLSWKSAFAAGQGGLAKLGSALPTGVIFPVPVGILYPSLNTAAGVNPAALTGGKKATSVLVAAAPPLESGDSISAMASLATNSAKVGWGLGYTGSIGGSSDSHGLFAGVGFKMGNLSAGVGLRDSSLSGGFSPNVDVGLRFETDSHIAFGVVAYNLDAGAQVAAGVGFGHPKKDNVEINILTPDLGGGSSDYTATFAATVYTGSFGTTFRTSYAIESQTFSHTLGGLFWISDSMNLILQLTTPRTLTIGLTYIF